jgi:hypothetical protein
VRISANYVTVVNGTGHNLPRLYDAIVVPLQKNDQYQQSPGNSHLQWDDISFLTSNYLDNLLLYGLIYVIDIICCMHTFISIKMFYFLSIARFLNLKLSLSFF